MIGNDVVDLSSSESRDIHPRFDELALTPAERAMMPGSTDNHLLRWQFWSAKEAAYKLLKRLYPHTSYVPRRFHVLPAPSGSQALVHHGHHVVQVHWDRHGQCVHAIARGTGNAARSPSLLTGQLALGSSKQETESSRLREKTLDSIAEKTGLERERISIRTRHRIPDLVTTSGEWLGFLSLSHHGRFGAYVCSLNEPRALKLR